MTSLVVLALAMLPLAQAIPPPDAQLSVVPCLKDISLPKSGPLKGSLAFTLVTDHNGHMR